MNENKQEHPIQGMMGTAMQKIREMIDVNTIIGDPITTPDGTVIIPVSRFLSVLVRAVLTGRIKTQLKIYSAAVQEREFRSIRWLF